MEYTFDYEMLFKIIGVVVMLVWTAFGVPWLKARIGIENYKKFRITVDEVVVAVEQIYNTLKKNGEQHTGEEKMEHAVCLLVDRGYEDTPDLRVAIEQSVYENT